MEENEIDDDYFEGGEDNEMDEGELTNFLANEKNRELLKRWAGVKDPAEDSNTGAQPEEPVDEAAAKVYFSDSEDEKEQRKKERPELIAYQESGEVYSEQNQMNKLTQQLDSMMKKKFKLRDKIKEFMASTFDPQIFVSISRLIAVEMIAYHQSVFERLCEESTLFALMSCLNPEETKFLLKIKSYHQNLLIKSKGGLYTELTPLLKITLLFLKEILLKYTLLIRNIIRRGTPQQNLETDLTSYEVACYVYTFLFFVHFKPRVGFLVSFDKLNLDSNYKLDMYAGPGDPNDKKGKKGKKPKKEEKKKKKKKNKKGKKDKDKGKDNKKKKRKSNKAIENGESDAESSSFHESDDDTSEEDAESEGQKSEMLKSESPRSEHTTKSAEQMFQYGPLQHANLKGVRDDLHPQGDKKDGKKKSNKMDEEKKTADPEHFTNICSFEHDSLSKELEGLTSNLKTLFGNKVHDLTTFHERYRIHKCFVEVYISNEGRFKIFNFQKFDLVNFKSVFIQKLLHRTCTLFVFSLRKAKAIYPENAIHAERKQSPFYEHKTLLKEITPCYVNEKWKILFRLQYQVNRSRYVKLPGILQSVTELNKHNPYNLVNEELEIEAIEFMACEQADLDVIPEKLFDFTYSRVYVIESKMKHSHAIMEGAKPIDVKVQDREIFLRRDLMKLYTRVQWRNRGKDIKRGEEPRKVLEFNDGNYRIEYFGPEQTIPLKIRLSADGKIPQNEYGNIEIMNGLPPGTRHLGFKGIKLVARKMDIDWVPAVTEFELKNGRFRPILNGIVVHDRDYDNVMGEYNKRKEELERREEEKELKFMDKIWKDIFKSLYTKRYFKDKQQ